MKNKSHILAVDITEFTYELIDRKTFLLPDGPEYVLDVVKRAVPVMRIDFAETDGEASVEAIIDFGITQLFVGQDSPYARLLERYGRPIPTKHKTLEQVVLWRSRSVRITRKYNVPIWGHRIDENSRPT